MPRRKRRKPNARDGKVQIYTCNGSGAQIWYYGQRGNIVYFNNSSLCLDAQDQSNGRQLIVLPCIFDNDGWPTLTRDLANQVKFQAKRGVLQALCPEILKSTRCAEQICFR